MMDAIGNTLQGTTAIRGSSQQSVTQTAQPEADPLAGSVNEPSRYYSPVVRIDSETQRTVLQFRDGSDGKVLVQYPSEKQLEAYRSKATTERAKEQEKAEARISGEQEAAGKRQPDRPTGTGQQAGSPIAGQSTVEGEFGESCAVHFPRYPVAAADFHTGLDTARRRIGTRVPWSGHRRRGPAGPPVDLRLERLPSLQTGSGTATGTFTRMGCDPSAT